MKKQILTSTFILSVFLFSNCSKEIEEPKQEANGSNVVYIKIDDKDEFLLDSRRKLFHKNTAAKFDDYDNDIIRYSEFNINNRIISDFSMYFVPFSPQKADFQIASINLRFDKQTQTLDTAFLNKFLTKTWNSVVYFHVKSDEYKEYYIDSILDYKVIKWDTENHIISFSANCTYSRSPKDTPPNPKLYFYFDLKYSL